MSASDWPKPVRCWPSPPPTNLTWMEAARTMFLRFGEMPHQQPAVLAARLERLTERQHAVYLWPGDQPRCVIALVRDGEQWRSVFPGAPVLTDGTIDGETFARICGAITADLKTELLYFPLAYPETAAARVLSETKGMAHWTRSSSPIVDWSDRGADLISRFRQRHGSQAERKLRVWRANLTTAVLDGDAAVEALTDIEQRSWKASAGIDLASAGQLHYYSTLLRAGIAVLTAAVEGSRPIAYRIDLRHHRNAYSVEWSFASDANRSAPGIFLLTAGLIHTWAATNLVHIDLFGAPDLLKSLVETRRQARIDFAWPRGAASNRLRAGRQTHDALLGQKLAAGTGIRRIYGGSAVLS